MRSLRLLFAVSILLASTVELRTDDTMGTVYPTQKQIWTSDSYLRSIPAGCIPDPSYPSGYRCPKPFNPAQQNNTAAKPTTPPPSNQKIKEAFINNVHSIIRSLEFKTALSTTTSTHVETAYEQAISSTLAGTKASYLKSLRVDPEKLLLTAHETAQKLPKDATFETLFQSTMNAVKKMDAAIDETYHGNEEAYLKIIRLFETKMNIFINEQTGTISFPVTIPPTSEYY